MILIEVFLPIRDIHRPVHIPNPFYELLIGDGLSFYLLLLLSAIDILMEGP